MRTDPGGSRGLDDYFTRDYARNIGAEIMGRNKFRPAARPLARPRLARLVGRGASVPHSSIRTDPPHASFVHPWRHHVPLRRPGPASVLDRARDAAQGKDVRLGGGATTIRQFLDAGLVDTMHVAVSQVELGSGSRLWESPHARPSQRGQVAARYPRPRRSRPRRTGRSARDHAGYSQNS
jgi:dihydrofolate reductase